MLKVIRKMEPLFVTDAECVGNIIKDLEDEIERQANERSLDVLFLLIERLENIERSGVDDKLRWYVTLKIARHHFRKRFLGGWGFSQMSNDVFYDKLGTLNTKIKEARRNYYVAKRYNG